MENANETIDLDGDVEKNPEHEEPIQVDGNLKRKKNKSAVWEHFVIPDPVPKDNPRTWCKYCKKDYAYDPGKIGTSSLWNHLWYQCKTYPYNKQNDKKQKTLVFQKDSDGDANLVSIAFNKDLCRKALARMVIIDELSFRFVEKEGFRYFCSVMQPKFDIPSRMTVARDVISLYVEEKKKLQFLLSNSSQQVCLTTDTWTSIQNINYMVLTAHFIDDNWKLQKRILNFECITNHKGESIGKMIEACLIAWGLEKILTITVDNASSNDVALSYMKRKIRNWGKSVLDCDFLHMRCCAHILNLVVTQGLKDYDKSIQVIRNAVRYVRSSPSRLHKFNECVEKEKLDVKGSVCLDVSTRWNSTYLMLKSAIKFRRAFERLEEDGAYIRYFNDGNGEDRLGPPDEFDWDEATSFMKFLELFYDATNRFSGSLYVTANSYFHELCSMYTHITFCMQGSNLKLKMMATEMKTKFDKYWGDLEKVNPLLFIAVVLDPRYKQEYVDWSFKDMYGDNDFSKRMSIRVEESMKRLYDHYCTQDPDHTKQRFSRTSNLGVGGENETGNIHERRLLKFKSFLKEGENGEKTELEKYLVDAKENIEDPFDVLGWWKINSPKYKVLSRIAKDVLAIPISTVSSESAFSTGGRVLDPFRSSLSPKTVQALICAQNWLRSEVSQEKVDIEGSLQEIQEIEKMCNYVFLTFYNKRFYYLITNSNKVLCKYLILDFMKFLNICTDHIE